MHSSLDPYWQPKQVEKLKKLLRCKHLDVISKQRSGNSVVYCVEANGEKWAIKSYPSYKPVQRNRLVIERSVYQFFNKYQVRTIPLLKAACEIERWLVIEWIDGKQINQYSSADIDQTLLFLHTIADLNDTEEALLLPAAAEDCLSLTIIINQIQARLQRLLLQAGQETSLNNFLLHEFTPVFARCCQQAKAGYSRRKQLPDTLLATEYRSLIAADFGFHNIIQDNANNLFFIDFDYFGWDDPVKLLADILWHPKMQLSTQQKQQFVDGLTGIYYRDPHFSCRFHDLFPLFGLRWVLIILNQFIPEYWQHREHDTPLGNQEEAKKIQLQRADILLLSVRQQIGYSIRSLI